VLPDFLDEIVLRHLTLGEDWVDVAIHRAGKEFVVNVLGRSGDIRVVTTS
jgi:hypothetical protein